MNNNPALKEKFFAYDPIFQSSVGFTSDYELNNKLVIVEFRPNILCHGCAVANEVHIFTKDRNLWSSTSRQVISYSGSFGKGPPAELTRIGPQAQALVLKPGFTNQGITVSSIEFYLRRKSKFVQILDIADYYGGNQGECDPNTDSSKCWEYSTELNFDAESTDEVFPLTVRKRGSRLDLNSHAITDAQDEQQYVFSGEKYVLQTESGTSHNSRLIRYA